MNKPKTLVFDIETSPIIAYVWGLRDQNISLNQIVKDWQVIAWSAKWLDAPANTIQYYDMRKNTERQILTPLWHLLDKADIVITQNGQSFDSRKLNARFISYGLNPPSSYKHLDTYRLLKRVAEFTSHKLEYLTDKLCTKYKKTSHSQFPGMSLWDQCLKGNIKAWNEMKHYNIRDVLSTEELYKKVQAWTPQALPNPEHICPRRYAVKYGIRQNVGYRVQIYKCMKCGKKFKGEEFND